jgi:hypothetical protein
MASLLINISLLLYHEKESETANEELAILVRYVFREAVNIYQTFSSDAKHTFKSIFVSVQRAIETAGGRQGL